MLKLTVYILFGVLFTYVGISTLLNKVYMPDDKSINAFEIVQGFLFLFWAFMAFGTSWFQYKDVRSNSSASKLE